MDKPIFQPPDGLALWLPLPTTGKAYLKTGCDHSVQLGLLALTIPEGFDNDGASIPRAVRWLIPTPTLNKIHRAGIAHDYLYRVQCCSRWQADSLFREVMDADGVPRALAFVCWISVRAFGRFVWKRNAVDSTLRQNRIKYKFDPSTEGFHNKKP